MALPLSLARFAPWLRAIPALLLAVVIVRQAPWTRDWPRVSLLAVAAMVAINFVVFLPLRTWRWRVALTTAPSFGSLYASLLEGLLASIALGFGSGDVVRAARVRGGFNASYGATIAERGAEIAAMAVLLLVGVATVGLGWLGLAIAGGMLLAYFGTLAFGRRLLPHLVRWPRVTTALAAGLEASTAPRVTAMVALSLAGWASELCILMVCLHAFGLPDTASLALLALLGINIATVLPGPPANVGTFEAGIVGGLALGGIGVDQALIFALGYHAIMTVPVALAGATVFLVRSR